MSSSLYVVFGASGDIGSRLAKNLVNSNNQVVLVSRESERLRTLSTELGMPAHVVDATDFGAVDALFQDLKKQGEVVGVANCVGSIVLKNAHLTSFEDYSAVIATNLTSAFSVVRGATKVMRKNGGSIALVSSCAAQIGLPRHEAISAAKAGVEGLMRSAAATYSRYKIRVNSVAPGLVETKLAAPILASEAGRKASVAMHPVGRIGRPDDVVSAIAWLLRPDNDWVTGQVIGVDGGLATLKS